MDRLELLVHQAALDEIRNRVSLVEESLPRAESFHQLLGRWRYIDGCLQGASGPPDPVLRPSELARRRVFASNALHESRMELTDETQ